MKCRVCFAIALLLPIAAWASGCGGGEPTAIAPQEELSLAQEQRATPPELKEATMTPIPTPEPSQPIPPPETEQVMRLAVEDLAGRLSVDVGEIGVLEVQEVIWPDSSLGCPQPGMAYKQVPEDGLLIRLDVGGHVYEYHSGGMRDPFLCEQTIKVKPPAIKFDLTKTIPPPVDAGDQ
jgi:hypothetical protein